MNISFIIGVLGILALASAWIGVAAIRRLAERRRFLDIPNERSSHTRPTPRGGGLAIVAVVFGGVWIYAVLWPGAPWGALGIFTVGAVLIAGVSWRDDLCPLPVWVRIATHGVGAGLAILAFGYWHAIGWPGSGCLPLGLFGGLMTFLWIVGLTALPEGRRLWRGWAGLSWVGSAASRSWASWGS